MLRGPLSRLVAACLLDSIATVACVYASDAPTPNSSGQVVTVSQNGTEPAPNTGSEDAATGPVGCQDSGAMDADSGCAPTWSEIYTAYFAASSLGRCGSSSCHASSRGGFKCGADKDTCYQGLVNVGLVDTTNGAQSAIADKDRTPLSWFGNGGTMPGGGANAKATADITAWVQAGAHND
jgi:hypothetical protein